MIEKFKQHIDDNLSFLKEGKLLVAVSGGIDSVVLVHLLHRLQLDVSLAHCNFKLRYADSDRDAIFVNNLANKLHIENHSIEFETETYAENNNLSTQMAARELRYTWFDELQKSYEYDYVLTAHHANDNLETVLINLTRGTSLNGLVGIPEINTKIIRPLLPFTRDDIEQFTITYDIIWREDESNQSIKYFRNKIRHQVVPVLNELNANLLQTFNEHLAYLKKEQKVLTQHLEAVQKEVCTFDGQLKINIKKLQKYDEVGVYLRHFLKAYNFTDWKNLSDLCHAQSGKYVLSSTHRLLKDRDFLLLDENKLDLEDSKFEITIGATQIDSPISLSFEYVQEVSKSIKSTIYIDANSVKYPLYLRKKKDGDVFYPFGMNGKKKLSKYFKDEKMSLTEKENCWLLCDANDAIIWVIGQRSDDRFCVDKTTREILKITLN